MRYQGGKKRIGPKIAKDLIALAQKVEKQTGKKFDAYYEPFVGMAGVFSRVVAQNEEVGTFKKFFASDISPDVIAFWKEVKNGWIPPKKISKEQWKKLRDKKGYSALKTFAGYGAGWGGQYYGGYVNNTKTRDFVAESQRAVLKTAPFMKKVHFSQKDYSTMKPKNMFLYLDPPYIDTTNYDLICRKSRGSSDSNEKILKGLCEGFDSKKFWETVRQWSVNNVVVVSELKAPADFVAYKTYDPITRSMGRQSLGEKSEKTAIEKLFIHKSLAKRLKQPRNKSKSSSLSITDDDDITFESPSKSRKSKKSKSKKK